MLGYVADGFRHYGTNPISISPRKSWEFQAIIKGKAAPLLPVSQPPVPPRGLSLWIFPPGHLHGWTSTQSCEVAVFQFLRLPEDLEIAFATLTRKRPEGRSVPLTPQQGRRLAEVAAAIIHNRHHPSPLLTAWTMQALAQVSLLALQGSTQRPSSPTLSQAFYVDKATGWFEGNMHAGVGANEMAAAAGLSPSHLRRVFHAHLGHGPQEAIRRMRLSRAETLLKSRLLTQAQIARSCGFGSVQAFSRFFQKCHQTPPASWAKKRQPLP